jgi:hypothetical protein
MTHQLDLDLEVILIQIHTFYATTESPMVGKSA